MRSQEKRIAKLEAVIDTTPKIDASLLSDQELQFFDEKMTKAGFDWNKEGDLSVLTANEVHKLETLAQKMTIS